ncbi:hypothetical protein JB92DRAFT_2827818 [Gautieria morchelliformis]|nr:hypothetical protein JB92DRAFT_2827818 [Gautieria morchelliformis]
MTERTFRGLVKDALKTQERRRAALSTFNALAMLAWILRLDVLPKLFDRYYLGTGLISDLDAMCSDGTCSSTTLSDGTVVRHAGPEAYGKLLVLTELFGSPFLKNISTPVGWTAGCIVSGATGYSDGSSIRATPAITFLWYAASNYYKVWICEATLRKRQGSTHLILESMLLPFSQFLLDGACCIP